MPDEEKNTNNNSKSSGINKILVIAIIILSIILIVGGLSIFVAESLWKTREPKPEPTDIAEIKEPPKIFVDLDEFLVSTWDNKGIIKAKLQLGISDEKTSQIANEHIGEIRDRIGRILVSKSLDEANQLFASGELQRELLREINKLLKPYLKPEKGLFGSKPAGKIVSVNFINFLAK